MSAAPVEGGDRADPLQAAFLDDPDVQKRLSSTLIPDQVQVDGYDAILFVGRPRSLNAARSTSRRRTSRPTSRSMGIW